MKAHVSTTDHIITAPDVLGLQYPRVDPNTSEVAYPDTLNDILAFGVLDPTVSLSPYSPLQDVLAVVFSHLSFIERVCVAPVSRAFYTAYRRFVDNGPLLQLVLAGDYMNVARVINKLSTEKVDLLKNSTTFAILMFLGGMSMVSLMNSLGGCDSRLPEETRRMIDMRYHFTTQWYPCHGRTRVHKRTSPDPEPRDLEELVIGRRYDLLEIELGEFQAHKELGCMLSVFHNRCVPSTPLCMYHQTHACLPTAIPQIIIDVHESHGMDVRLLATCIYAARTAHNADDEIWLQERYPDLYWCAIAMNLRIQDSPRIKCNMKHAGNFNDIFSILKMYDATEAYKRF
jgi:hypothetical protein